VIKNKNKRRNARTIARTCDSGVEQGAGESKGGLEGRGAGARYEVLVAEMGPGGSRRVVGGWKRMPGGLKWVLVGAGGSEWALGVERGCWYTRFG
jgi:hypothetical protein